MASENSSIINSLIGVIHSGQGDLHISGGVHVSKINTESLPLDDFPLPRLIDTFHGRGKETTELYSLYFEQNVRKVVVCGLPGFGKTELCKQFAQLCLDKEKVQKVLWVEAEKKELKMLYPKLKKIYEQYNENCLCIFDNGACRRDITLYEPPEKDNFFLLITSQEMDWGKDMTPVQLKPLCPQFSMDILKSILGTCYEEENNSLYNQLAHIVDNVPLGLQIIGRYILREMEIEPNFDLEKYFEKIQQSQEEFMMRSIPRNNTNSYEYSIYGAMQVSLNKIKEEEDKKVSELAVTVLYVCAYLDPCKISDQDLLKISNTNEIVPQCNNTNIQMKLALKLLVNFSFINNDLDVKIHRLAQRFLRYHLSESGQGKYYSACLNYGLHDEQFNTHLMSVFSYADENTDIVYDICKKEKNSNIDINYNLRKFSKNNDTNRSFILYRKENSLVGDILSWLVECGCHRTLEKIFENTSKVNKYISKYNLLNTSIEYNQIHILKLLLKYVNRNEIKKFSDILFTAVNNGIIETISILIEHGANLHIQNVEGDTPLFVFARNYLSAHVNWTQILALFKYDKTVINGNKETLLHVAAAGCHVDLIEKLILDDGMEVNQQDSRRRTPLHALAYKISSEDINISNIHRITSVLEQFMKHGALLNIKDSKRRTVVYLLFCHAVKYNELEILNWLLLQDAEEEKSSDISKLDIHRIAPVLKKFLVFPSSSFLKDSKYMVTEYLFLYFAVDATEVEFLRWLLPQSVNRARTTTILRGIVDKGNLEIIELLIEHGALLNSKYSDDNSETIGHRLLSRAVKNDEPEFFQRLLQNDALTTTIRYRKNMLYEAIAQANFEIIKILVEDGIPLSTKKNYLGENLLFTFARNKNVSQNLDWKEVLVLFKFEVTERNSNLESLLHIAAIGCQAGLIETLIIDYGMDVDQLANLGRTPIHSMLYDLIDNNNSDNYVIVPALKQFIKYGASLDIKDSEEQTARNLIMKCGIEIDLDETIELS